MDAWVDDRHRVVRSGGEEWLFALDLRTGTAGITVRGVAYRITPLRWIEKRRLARLAHLGENFVTEQFWRLCVAPGDREFAAEPLALARWLSSGGLEAQALPLDSLLLARVTAQTCRALGIAPTTLDDLEACEVEALWRQDGGEPEDPMGESISAQSGFTRKVVVVPDEAMPHAAAGQPLPDHAAEIPALGMPHAAAGQPLQDHAAEIPALGMITERADDALLAAADLAESPLAVAMVKEPTERQIAPSNAKFPHSADHLQDVPPVGRQRVSPVPGQRTQQASGVFGSVASGEAGQARGVSPRSGAQARSGGRSGPGRIAGRRFRMSREAVVAGPALDQPAKKGGAPSDPDRPARGIGEEATGYFGPFRWNVARLRRDSHEASGFAPRERPPSEQVEFDEEFAERLRLAAADLGIGEET